MKKMLVYLATGILITAVSMPVHAAELNNLTETASVVEIQGEDAEKNIASGIGMGYNWVIDSTGKLIIRNTEEVCKLSEEDIKAYKDRITAVDVEVKEAIGFDALFSGCKNLKTARIKVEKAYGGASALFVSCSALEKVDLSEFDTSNIDNMSYMFEECVKLTKLDLSNFNTENVTDMCCMFEGCEELTELNITSFNTENVTNMEDMFFECVKLTKLDLSSFNTENVTDMSNMFCFNSKLSDLNISSFNTKNVIDMGGMFADCTSLESLDISHFDMSSLKKAEDMLMAVYVSSIKIPANVPIDIDLPEGPYWKIQDETENNKEQLSFFPKGLDHSVTLVPIEEENPDYEFFERGAGYISTLDKAGKMTVKGIDSRNFIASNATLRGYCYCSKKIITAEFDADNAKSLSCAFREDDNLKEAKIRIGNYTGHIEEMFLGCTALEKVDFSGTKGTELENMAEMFKGCVKLKEVDLSVFDATGVRDMTDMFKDSGVIKIKTPVNVPVDANLPEGKTWIIEGTNEVVTIMPKGLDHSVTLLAIDNPFADVAVNGWQYQFAQYALENGIMSGKGKTETGKVKFDPDNKITRSEFVQVLYNMEKTPEVTYEAAFKDVPEGEWFTNAIVWARKNGITVGKGENFDVKGQITREEMATMLKKYAALKKYDVTAEGDLSAYSDESAISSWAVENIKWAVGHKVMSGKGKTLDPVGPATRAECAAMIKNLNDAFQNKAE